MRFFKNLFSFMFITSLIAYRKEILTVNVITHSCNNNINFGLTETGQLQYWISHNDKTIIDKS